MSKAETVSVTVFPGTLCTGWPAHLERLGFRVLRRPAPIQRIEYLVKEAEHGSFVRFRQAEREELPQTATVSGPHGRRVLERIVAAGVMRAA